MAVSSKKTREQADRLRFVFGALGDPTRLNLFRFLMKKKNLCVTELAEKFAISVPAVSYQMKVLERIGLVKRERTGRRICYKLKNEDPLVRRIIKVVQ